MIDSKTVQEIRQAPIPERLQIIELILQSLKEEISPKTADEQPPRRAFALRQFSLGEEVHADRDQIYAERGA